MNSTTKDVLVVLPTLRDKTALENYTADYRFHLMEDEHFLLNKPILEFDMVQYTERCSEYIQQHNIQAILYSHDLASLIVGVLCDRHKLPGPTFESMFVSIHKYYSRCNELAPLWSDYINLGTGEWGNNSPIFPCYIKPAFLALTLLQFKVNSPEELEDARTVLRRELPSWTKRFYDFFAAYVDLNKYPLATKDIVVVDELIEDAAQYVVEGWSDPDGTPHLWAVSDSNYYPGSQLAIDNYSAPSNLPDHVREKMVNFAVKNVQSHGIKGGFWNVELWVKGDRYILTEINGRSASVWHELYSGTYQKSLYKAMLHLSCGEPERCLEEVPYLTSSVDQRVGGQFHVITFGEGKAGDFLDYEYLRALTEPEVEIFVPEDFEIHQTRTSGFWLARFHLFGSDYNSICKQADKLRARMLKQPELSPQPLERTFG